MSTTTTSSVGRTDHHVCSASEVATALWKDDDFRRRALHNRALGVVRAQIVRDPDSFDAIVATAIHARRGDGR